jgi:hypothetical protein
MIQFCVSTLQPRKAGRWQVSSRRCATQKQKNNGSQMEMQLDLPGGEKYSITESLTLIHEFKCSTTAYMGHHPMGI